MIKGDHRQKTLFDGDDVYKVRHINPYPRAAEDIWINSRSSFMISSNPKMVKGNEPTDGGNLFLTAEEKDVLELKYPALKIYQTILRGQRVSQ